MRNFRIKKRDTVNKSKLLKVNTKISWAITALLIVYLITHNFISLLLFFLMAFIYFFNFSILVIKVILKKRARERSQK